MNTWYQTTPKTAIKKPNNIYISGDTIYARRIYVEKTPMVVIYYGGDASEIMSQARARYQYVLGQKCTQEQSTTLDKQLTTEFTMGIQRHQRQ